MFAYLLYALGAATPYLQSEFSLSDTVAGLHSSAFAIGTAAAGLAAEPVFALVGRTRALWVAATTEALAGLALALVHHPAATLLAALAMGLAGSLLLALANAGLVERHREESAAVLTEAQIGASCGSLLTSFVVGAAAGTWLSWRVAMVVPIVAVGFLALAGRGLTIVPTEERPGRPSEVEEAAASHRRLPAAFWLCWLVVVLVIVIEFSFVFWGPSILAERPGLSQPEASSSMAFYIGGMLVGRVTGSVLARRRALSGFLLPAGLILAALGAVATRLSPSAPVSDLALAAAGLGIGNLYPQAVDAALRAVPGKGLTASARCSLAFGIALLVGPAALGAIGDVLGVLDALWAIAAIAVIALLLAAVPVRARQDAGEDRTGDSGPGRTGVYDTRQV